MSYKISNEDQLVQRLENLAREKKRVVVAVAGVPGAGKTTLVGHLVEKLRTKKILAAVLPQDGYHYYRLELAQFEDPEEAFRRRGAPFTFNAERFVEDVTSVAAGKHTKVPLFDHSKKDPVEDDIDIGDDVRVVLIEGNYVGLEDEPWNRLKHVCNELWVASTPPETVRERIVRRHLASGIAATTQEAEERADGLDLQNAIYIQQHTRKPDVVIELG